MPHISSNDKFKHLFSVTVFVMNVLTFDCAVISIQKRVFHLFFCPVIEIIFRRS